MPEVIRGHQRSSAVISGHQRSSEEGFEEKPCLGKLASRAEGVEERVDRDRVGCEPVARHLLKQLEPTIWTTAPAYL